LRAAQERERQLQHQLMQAQKVQALGTLAGGIAHDLNNTLVPILALATLARNELPADHPLREDLDTMVCASERARDLVKRILAFSRPQKLGTAQVDVADVVRQAVQMLRATVPATVGIVEAIDATPCLQGDPGELHQVVVNLVTNAAQAIGPATGSITIRLQASGGDLRLSVEDTGCGVDAATIDRIFEPFFTTKEVGEGTGLGLSVVHGIVTSRGGRIDVDSETGRGTTVTVVLPIDSVEPLVLAAAAA
jgi:signal transduction histidine kinase